MNRTFTLLSALAICIALPAAAIADDVATGTPPTSLSSASSTIPADASSIPVDNMADLLLAVSSPDAVATSTDAASTTPPTLVEPMPLTAAAILGTDPSSDILLEGTSSPSGIQIQGLPSTSLAIYSVSDPDFFMGTGVGDQSLDFPSYFFPAGTYIAVDTVSPEACARQGIAVCRSDPGYLADFAFIVGTSTPQ